MIDKDVLLEWGARLGALVFVVVFGTAFYVTCTGRDIAERENKKLREELARQQEHVPMVKEIIRDTVEVVTREVIPVEKIKSVLSDDDRALLKDIKMKAGELSSYQVTGVSSRDTVVMIPVDSTGKAPLHYKDAWAEFWYDAPELAYHVRDSLAIAVKKLPKKRFLWWKWGVKGYEVKAVNFNPHATVRYNRIVYPK
jgi:hypothetical protein